MLQVELCGNVRVVWYRVSGAVNLRVLTLNRTTHNIQSMTADLRDEIRQARPFGSLQQEAFLNLGRTAAALEHGMEQLLKPYGVSLPQYNVLRILRGAGVDGLCRNEIRDRLIARMPDVTRMLDRMELMGLVRRERSSEDRRQMNTFLTDAGAALLQRLDRPIEEEHERQLKHLSEEQLRTLITLSTLARQSAE